MALSEKYIPLTSLDQYFVDKDTGLPLSEGTLTFYSDVDKITPKVVYQLSGTYGNYSYVSLTNQVILNSVGTAQDSGGNNSLIYGYPYDADGNVELYYIECASSGAVSQWTRSAIPNLTSDSDTLAASNSYSNQLSNPQFTEYFFENEDTTTLVFSSAAAEEVPIAPEWDLVVTGTGSVIISRDVIAGSSNIETQPPYALSVTVPAGITICELRQRLDINSGVFRNGYLSSSVTAKLTSGTSSNLTMTYLPSSGIGEEDLLTTGLTSDLTTYYGSIYLTASTNSDTGADGYTDIIVDIPPSTTVQFTSVQVIPSITQPTNDIISYDQRTSNQEKAFMANYYTPRLVQLQQKNILTAWDFKYNPAQIGVTQTISQDSTTGVGEYIWDQTICARTSNDVTVARSSLTGGMEFTTTVAPTSADSFYVMQYLEGADAQAIIGNKLAVNVSAFKDSVADLEDVTMQVYLFAAPSSASFPDISTGTAAVAVNVSVLGVATLTSSASSDGWFEVSRSNMTTATATLSGIDSSTPAELNTVDYDYSFNNWELSGAQITDLDKLACVVTFSYVSDASVVTLNSVNLVPGDLCYRPVQESYNDILRKCQYYYERSYEVGTDTGEQTNVNQYTYTQGAYFTSATTTNFYINALNFHFKTSKRSTSTVMTYYNPTIASPGTEDTFRYEVFNVATSPLSVDYTFSAIFTIYSTGKDSLFYTNAVTNPGFLIGLLKYSPVIRFHYTADSRIGIT